MSTWAAILAGGSGTRFWPLSTPERPKQFLPLISDRPLLAQTVARLHGLVTPEHMLILTGPSLVDRVAATVPEIPHANIFAEPRAASTAPALAWAAHWIAKHDPGGEMLSLHADWAVGDDAAFRAAAAQALAVAVEQDVLVTVGIKPTRNETGYGYIVPGGAAGRGSKVKRFIEKPSAARAALLRRRGALWNSGLFAWSAARFLGEAGAYAEELAPGWPALTNGDAPRFFAAVRRRDARGNVTVGNVTLGDDVKNSVIWSENETIAVVGIEDMVVVRANGHTLVMPTGRPDKLKALVQSL